MGVNLKEEALKFKIRKGFKIKNFYLLLHLNKFQKYGPNIAKAYTNTHMPILPCFSQYMYKQGDFFLLCIYIILIIFKSDLYI